MAVGFALTYDQGQFKRLIGKLAEGETRKVVHQSTQQVADFLLEKVREYPAQKSVTRKAAYGVTFFTTKQQRFFFAALARGEIQVPYRRTQALARGWRVQARGNARTLTNAVPYAGVVMGQGTQSRLSRLIGWRTDQSFIRQYGGQIGRVAIQPVRRWARG